MMSLPPEQIGVRYRRIERLHSFIGLNLPGLHIAAADPQAAFELLVPVISEILRRAHGLEVEVRLATSFGSFRERMTLAGAFKAAVPKVEGQVPQRKLLAALRLHNALVQTGAMELGLRNRHAAYWQTKGGTVFSVMPPMTRTQDGVLLYPDAYARDLLTRLTGIEAGTLPIDPAAPDLVLHRAPL